MPLTEPQSVNMDVTVRRLRSAYSQSMTHVGGSFWTPGSGTDAIRGALRMDLARIEDLDNRLREQVQRGELSYAKWMGIAQTVAEDLETQSGYVVSWGNFWTDVVVKSADDAGALAKTGFAIGAPVVVFIAVAALAVYLLMLRRAVPI